MKSREQTGEKFYVYTHTDKDGDVFYVGKGKGDRAWKKNERHELWQKYLENIGGEYTVTIVEKDLDEESALSLENRLISQHRCTLINWINPDRHGDWATIAKYWELRKEDDEFHARVKEVEKDSLEDAVKLYKEEIMQVQEYLDVLMKYYGAEVSNSVGKARRIYQDNYIMSYVSNHDLRALDRLTICLKTLGRLDEAREEVEKFFEEYPFSSHLRTADRIKNRIAKKPLKPGA